MKTILECSSTPTPTPTPTTTPITTAVTEIEGKGWLHAKINEILKLVNIYCLFYHSVREFWISRE